MFKPNENNLCWHWTNITNRFSFMPHLTRGNLQAPKRLLFFHQPQGVYGPPNSAPLPQIPHFQVHSSDIEYDHQGKLILKPLPQQYFYFLVRLGLCALVVSIMLFGILFPTIYSKSVSSFSLSEIHKCDFILNIYNCCHKFIIFTNELSNKRVFRSLIQISWWC